MVEFPEKLSSASVVLLTITSYSRMVSQNISRGVLVNVLMNISPSNIFPNVLLPVEFHQNCPSVLCYGEH